MSATHRLLRFGVFELNLDTEELRKEGLPIKLGPQPFKVLAILVAGAGQIVARDEIREKIWGEETYVDFEHGLNQCIKQIRTALNDNTNRPLYIETIPRKGYRFLAPVTSKTITVTSKVTVSSSGIQPRAPLGVTGLAAEMAVSPDSMAPQAVASIPVAAKEAVLAEAGSEAVVAESSAAARAPRRRLAWGVLRWLAPVIFLAIALAYYWRSERASALTETDTIVIADFANKTGDPVFDDTLRTAVSMAINQSPFLNVLSENKLKQTLELMRRPGDSALTPDVAREVGERAGIKAYISGSIESLGKEYVLNVRAVNCRTGDILAQEQETAASKEQVLNAVGKATTKLRSQLGETLATVQKFDVPLVQATTSSLEALQAYSQGVKTRAQKGQAAALPYFERALELDPKFATASAEVGGIYNYLGETGRASEYIAKAFELRDHASDREKLFITRTYYESVTGELDKAERTNLEMVEDYPRHASYYKDLGIIYGQKGRYDKAVEVVRQALVLAPNAVPAYEDLANFLLAAQHPDEARQVIRDAHERKLDDYLLHLVLYALAFSASDSTAMAEQQQWLANTPSFEHWGLSLASDTAAYSGRLGEATDLTKRAVASALQAEKKESGAIWWEHAALRDAGFGKLAESKAAIAAGLKIDPKRKGVEVEAALAYAMAGDNSRAESMAKDLDASFALDTQVQLLWLPAIRAQLALNRMNPAEAVNQLQVAMPPIEYGQIPFNANLSCLYPTYIRGQALLVAGQGAAAATEFQKLLYHNGITWNCWTGALAYLGLARAHAMEARGSSGAKAEDERAKALQAYKTFLTLWKDADSDIPIYQQAKAEYTRLQ